MAFPSQFSLTPTFIILRRHHISIDDGHTVAVQLKDGHQAPQRWL